MGSSLKEGVHHVVGKESLWRVVFIARGGARADRTEQCLTAEGFLVRRRESSRISSRSGTIVELMVLESEAREARMYLLESGLQGE